MPNANEVHIDAALTNLSVGYRNPAFIADLLAPVVPVRKQSDKYFICDAEREAFRPSDDRRAPGAEASEVNFALSSDNYYCEDHALTSAIPDEERENADPVIQPAIDRTRRLPLLPVSQEMPEALISLELNIWRTREQSHFSAHETGPQGDRGADRHGSGGRRVGSRFRPCRW